MKLPKQNMLYSSNTECSHLKQKATMIFQCSHILKENKTKQCLKLEYKGKPTGVSLPLLNVLIKACRTNSKRTILQKIFVIIWKSYEMVLNHIAIFWCVLVVLEHALLFFLSLIT